MRSPWSLAEERAERSEDGERFLLAFNAGWQVALAPDIDCTCGPGWYERRAARETNPARRAAWRMLARLEGQ